MVTAVSPSFFRALRGPGALHGSTSTRLDESGGDTIFGSRTQTSGLPFFAVDARRVRLVNVTRKAPFESVAAMRSAVQAGTEGSEVRRDEAVEQERAGNHQEHTHGKERGIQSSSRARLGMKCNEM